MDFVDSIKLFTVFTMRYLIIAGFAFSIFYLVFKKAFGTNKIQKENARSSNFGREIFYSVLANLVFVLIAFFVEFGPIGKFSLLYQDINAFPLWYLPISVILALVVHDAYFYWMHRTIHSDRLYRLIHKTHHLSINPSPFAAFSFHIVESALEALVIVFIIFLIPMHISMVLVFTTLSLMINVYGHLGYEIAPKWYRKSILFEILNSSVHHNMHHKYFKGNYGLYFRFWDRIMGTENPKYVSEYDALQAERFSAKASSSDLISS
jgi:sterol desaturase/sphingolipid hydroxylase (fatty acid hydroxylase superfamily)